MLEERHHAFMQLVKQSGGKRNIHQLFELAQSETTLFGDVDVFYNTYYQLDDMGYVYSNADDAYNIYIKQPKAQQYFKTEKRKAALLKQKQFYEYWQFWLSLALLAATIAALIL